MTLKQTRFAILFRFKTRKQNTAEIAEDMRLPEALVDDLLQQALAENRGKQDVFSIQDEAI